MQRAIGRFVSAVRETIARHELLSSGAHVLVAISGGADSTATLAALAMVAKRLKVGVSAAHIHHGLRGAAADADARAARSLARRFGVPFHSTRLSPALRRGGNIEERARLARYRALAAIARRSRATCVATGHTRDDQAETVLLRIIRGCGPSGLAGILPDALIAGVRVVRPLLNCSRAEVEQFIAAQDLSFCDDSSNRDRRFLRNRVRLDVLPLLRELNPQIDRALADLASMTQEADWRSQSATRPEVVLTVSGLRAKPASQRAAAVREWLAAVRGSRRGVSRRHVLAVLSVLRGLRPSRRIELPGGVVVREYDSLRFVRRSDEPAATPQPTPIVSGQRLSIGGWKIDASPFQPWDRSSTLPLDLHSAVIDAEVVARGLVARPVLPGDRVQPFGMSGRRKLSDVFIDRKVPQARRAAWPVVQAGPDILWVPGVVRSAVGLVRPRTKRVVWLYAKSAPEPLMG